MDAREGGDIHMLIHQFSTRQRLATANGHTENHVMQIGGRWGFTEQAPDLGVLFGHMDAWLMGIRNDRTTSELSEKVRAHKPAGLTDACWRSRKRCCQRQSVSLQPTPAVSDLNNCNPIKAAESALRSIKPSALRGTLPEPRWRMMSLPVICVLPIALTMR